MHWAESARYGSGMTGAARWLGVSASHYPERCTGVANLCVPYIARGFAPVNFVPLVDRTIYPEAEFPAGQWEYMFFYEESFPKAQMAFEANVANTVRAIFRAGSSAGKGKPARTALYAAMAVGSAD